jgi:hypothetical protein
VPPQQVVTALKLEAQVEAGEGREELAAVHADLLEDLPRLKAVAAGAAQLPPGALRALGCMSRSNSMQRQGYSQSSDSTNSGAVVGTRPSKPRPA